MKNICLALLSPFLLYFTNETFAQNYFERTYGDENNDVAYSIVETSDNGFIIAGSTSSGMERIYLVKIDSLGDTVWTKTIGSGTYQMETSDIIATSDNNYALVGFINDVNSGNTDIYLLKINQNGDTLWSKSFGGALSDRGKSLKQTNDGGFIICGRTESFGNDSTNFYIIKTNSDGDSLWTRVYGGDGREEANDVIIDQYENYIITGFTTSYGAGKHDFYILKLNQAGDTLWTRSVGAADREIAYSIALANDGGLVTTGYTTSFSPNNTHDIFTVKLDNLGDLVWQKQYGGSGLEGAYGIRKTNDNGFIICGFTSSSGNGGADVFLLKLNASGDSIWSKTYGTENDEYANYVINTYDDGYAVCGYKNTNTSNKKDIYLLRVDKLGQFSSVFNQYIYHDLSLFPNPAKDELIFNGLNYSKGFLLQIFDLEGKLVHNESYAGNGRVNISKLTSGNYLYRVITDGKFYNGKLLKQ